MKPLTLSEAMRQAIAKAIAGQPSHVVGISRGCLWQSVSCHLHRLAPTTTTRAQAEAEYNAQICRQPWSRFVYADNQQHYTQRHD